MEIRYYTLKCIPDLSLARYTSFDGSDVSGVVQAHSHFWRQIHRKGLLDNESFHLFYEYNPERPSGNRLRVGLCVSSDTNQQSFIEETLKASPISPFFSLLKMDKFEADRSDPDPSKHYRFDAHLIKKERFFHAREYGAGSYYMTSEWKMNEGARLYVMAKLMETINLPCLYVVSIYPKEWSMEMTTRLDGVMNELRNTTKIQVSRSGGGIGVQGKDEHAKSALDFYEDLLNSLAESPHFLTDVQVLSDNLAHASTILDAAAGEALEEGTHEQVRFSQNHSLEDVINNGCCLCADEKTPEGLECLPQLFLLEELSAFATFPTLYPGEWIELPKETVPEAHGNGLDLGIDDANHQVYFPLKNLSKHAFLAGVPGSGKTNSMMHLIHEMHGIYKIPVLIFEPAKHEYRAIICVEGLEDIELFSPSASTRFPLHINPFEFPKGMTLAEHIRNLIAVFDGAFSLDPPMPFLLDSSVEEVYRDRGWIPSMVNIGRLRYPTMSQLYKKLEEKIDKTDYGDEIKGNLKSALQVRIGSLITREMADIFDVEQSTIKPQEWLKRSAIIELESLGKDPANFTTLLVATLVRETLKIENFVKMDDGRPRHVMFFEEAHNLIGPTSEKIPGQDADPKTAATAYIVKMLAEVRALGEGIIIADQLPTAMAPEVLKNTSLKIGLRITAEDDRQLLGGTMNANPDQLEKMAIFSPGHGMISYEPLLKPFEVQLPYFEAKEGDLNDKTILIAMMHSEKYFNNLKSSLIINMNKWEKTAEQIRKKFDSTRPVIRNAIDAEQDYKKLRYEQKDYENASKTLREAFADAHNLCMQVLAYRSPFTFLESKEWNKNPKVKQFLQDIAQIEKKSEDLFHEILAEQTDYAIKTNRRPFLDSKHNTQRKLYVESSKTWKDM